LIIALNQPYPLYECPSLIKGGVLKPPGEISKDGVNAQTKEMDPRDLSAPKGFLDTTSPKSKGEGKIEGFFKKRAL